MPPAKATTPTPRATPRSLPIAAPDPTLLGLPVLGDEVAEPPTEADARPAAPSGRRLVVAVAAGVVLAVVLLMVVRGGGDEPGAPAATASTRRTATTAAASEGSIDEAPAEADNGLPVDSDAREDGSGSGASATTIAPAAAMPTVTPGSLRAPKPGRYPSAS